MSVDEAMRLRIHAKLTELMGPEEASAMVSNWLPWHEVATRDDLRVQSAELRTEMAELRVYMQSLVISQTRWILGYITALAAALVAASELL